MKREDVGLAYYLTAAEDIARPRLGSLPGPSLPDNPVQNGSVRN